MDSTGLSAQGKGVTKDEGFHDPVKHDLKDEDIMDWQTVNYSIERLKNPSNQPFFIACGTATVCVSGFRWSTHSAVQITPACNCPGNSALAGTAISTTANHGLCQTSKQGNDGNYRCA